MFAPAQQKKMMDKFHVEIAKWLDKILQFARDFKENQPNDKIAKNEWAQRWTRESDNLLDELDDLSMRILLAEQFGEISPKTNAPATEILITLAKVLHQITENMYKIINEHQNKRVLPIKTEVVQRLKELQAESDNLVKRLEDRKSESKMKVWEEQKRASELRKKLELEEIDKRARLGAAREHLRLLQSVNTKREMANVNVDCSTVDEQTDNDVTLVEPTLKHRRRSRSLSKKIMGTVKDITKNLRRSLSTHHRQKLERDDF